MYKKKSIRRKSYGKKRVTFKSKRRTYGKKVKKSKKSYVAKRKNISYKRFKYGSKGKGYTIKKRCTRCYM